MMRFRARKVYGESKVNHCAFCGSIATQNNAEGVLVCRHHLHQKLEEIKCTCGSWLEQKVGKFGPYFNCVHCGNINFNKAMEMKAVMGKENSSPVALSKPITTTESFAEREKRMRQEDRKGKEITITSDDVEYFS